MFKSRLLEHFFFLASGAVVNFIFAYLFRVICTRMVPLEEYGKLALFFAQYNNLIIIAYLNMGGALTKYVSEYRVKNESRIASFYTSALLIGIVSSSIAFMVSIAMLIRDNLFSPVLATCLFFSFYLFAVYRTNVGVLQGFQKMKETGALAASLSVFRFVSVLGSAFLFRSLTVESAFLAYVLGIYLTSILSLFWALRLLRIRLVSWHGLLASFKKGLDRPAIKQILFFSGYTVPQDLLSTATYGLVPIAMLSLTSLSDVAHFDVTLMMYSVATLIMPAVGTTLLPEVSKMEARGTPLNYRYVLKCVAFSFLVLIAIIYILFYVKIDVAIINLVFGREFLPSAAPLRILVLALPFKAYNTVTSNLLQGIGKPQIGLKVSLFSFSASLILYCIVLLAMQAGIVGAAITFVTVEVLSSAYSWYEFQKHSRSRKSTNEPYTPSTKAACGGATRMRERSAKTIKASLGFPILISPKR